MDEVSLTHPTFKCPTCDYKHFALYDPYEPGRMAAEFPEFPGIGDGDCPACFSGRNRQHLILPSKLERYSDGDGLTVTTAASDTDLEATTKPVFDDHGQPVMEQVGEHYELQVNQSTGAVGSVLVPDYAPMMRPLTDQELADLKLQRDQNLDALAPVTVSETTT